MAYQVLARKWRPQTFDEVVGQEHISRTLKNAIVNNRIGYAYLFVGSRGIGKTTTARIFAKALNCPNNHDGEPCCKCKSCQEVAAGTSLDVIEIDGASHNKVEDIRDIRDSVQYAPANGKYKIYIIDEFHMLTTQAWNAQLKTLEEPPPQVKFLCATICGLGSVRAERALLFRLVVIAVIICGTFRYLKIDQIMTDAVGVDNSGQMPDYICVIHTASRQVDRDRIKRLSFAVKVLVI